MKILLVGNYPYLKSQSMNRFVEVLEAGLKNAGHQVRLLKPSPVIGRMLPSATGLGKWLGYLDRFILFRPWLTKAVDWADVVHICDQANAAYVPWLNAKPHVVTCHDMLAIRSALGEISKYTTGLTGRVYQRWILAGLNQARYVACVSKTTHDEVLRLTNLRADRVLVVRNGLNYRYRPMCEKRFLQHLIQIGIGDIRPFFLHVGNNNWYKNKEGLLRIFGNMARHRNGQQCKLVIAGTSLTDDLRNAAKEIGIYNRIREATSVSDEQLCALYSAAEGLIFPSLAEGFGWPIIEAQACGCPVFTPNRKPMTEVGGDGAIYFDPRDEAGAAEIILQTIQDKDLFREKGYRNAIKYSNEGMIDGYIQSYRQVII